MDKRFVISGSSKIMGRAIRDEIIKRGYNAVYCEPDRRKILSKLTKKSCLYIFEYQNQKKTSEIIKAVHDRHEYMPIIAGMCGNRNNRVNTLILKGASTYILLPHSLEETTDFIINTAVDKKMPPCSPDISNCLKNMNFPSNLSGFGYFCLAIQLYLQSPEKYYNMTMKLYDTISKITDRNSSQIERSMRNFCKISEDSGVTKQISDSSKHYTNHEMLYFLTDFIVKNKVVIPAEIK